MKALNIFIAGLAIVSFSVGCSSKPPKAEISSSASPTDEIASLENDLKQANLQQADVLSPVNYKKAEGYLADAKKLREKGKSNEDVLEKVAYGRSYLTMTTATVAAAEKTYPEILSSRKAALTADAHSIRPKDLANADDDLKSEMKKLEAKLARMDNDDRDKLNKKYLDIQLECIKVTYLGQAKDNLKMAKKANADKNSPRTYNSAEAKIAAAERAIEADRSNTTAVSRAANDALAETQKLEGINNLVKNSNKMTPEEIALAIDARNKTINNQNQDIEAISSNVEQKDRQLNAQRASINAVLSENDKLESKEKFNQAFEDAQKQFSKDEAEVYRQGSNLLIRLKAFDFKSGQSSLSEKSLSVLSKVKSVIQEMGAQKVTVEGHTDSIGAKALNEKLSKERASTVAQYFITEDVVSKNNVASEGFGFEKPIASNKTKEGRAQNRRVDVIITPAGAESTAQ